MRQKECSAVVEGGENLALDSYVELGHTNSTGTWTHVLT